MMPLQRISLHPSLIVELPQERNVAASIFPSANGATASEPDVELK